MSTPKMVIVDGVRTPFCKAGTDFANLDADELGKVAVNNLLTRNDLDPMLIDEVIVGCVGNPNDAANLGRVIALRAGIPDSVPAITVSRNCASGMEAFTQAYEKICADRGEIFVVAGVESMSNYPLLFNEAAKAKFTKLARARGMMKRLNVLASFRPSDLSPRIALQLGLNDPVVGMNMGETAELLVREGGISREEQDEFALESHLRAASSLEQLEEEICPVYNKGKAILFDNGVRENQTMEALGKLRPVFDRRNGTVTAGNASQITDGAVALLVMTERKAAELDLKPIGELTGYTYAGCDPARMGLGPVHAMAKAEERTGLNVDSADLVEINEAFAAQVLACLQAVESEKFARKVLGRARPVGAIPMEKLNVNGGGISLGHPVGATGARLILTSLRELKRRHQKRALLSLCVGGGQGAAIWLEAL
ncbi:MAG: acetyl-CoA C-acyltransferase [Verrucomicrobiales bacterium]|nr:acetyl-CoA C-acyltransferase [Verrucomicrobiales bacterium]